MLAKATQGLYISYMSQSINAAVCSNVLKRRVKVTLVENYCHSLIFQVLYAFSVNNII